jgi:hypothetical protein
VSKKNSIAATILTTIFAIAILVTITNAQEGLEYEERVSFGLFFERTTISDMEVVMKIQNNPFDISMDYLPLFGVGAHMPITKYFGLNGIVGMQNMTFKYAIQDTEWADSVLADLDTRFIETDFKNTMETYNLVTQAGFELGLPVFSDYESQSMLKVYTYGSGILGKTFWDSKFQNTNLWGYAYGGGLRYAVGMINVSAGARGQSVWWESNLMPEYAGENKDEDIFTVDYKSIVSPFIKLAFSFY